MNAVWTWLWPQLVQVAVLMLVWHAGRLTERRRVNSPHFARQFVADLERRGYQVVPLDKEAQR